MLGDDIIDAAVPGAKQLADCYARHGLGTVALMEVPREETLDVRHRRGDGRSTTARSGSTGSSRSRSRTRPRTSR